MRKNLCRLGVLAVAAFGMLGRGSAVAAADAGGSDRVVVMVSVDGLAAYYLDDPKAEMPTIRRLAGEGARAESMKASTPTVTWTNHATLATGVNPARHGVMGNNYYDRKTGKTVTLIGDPTLDRDQILRAPTVWDAAHAAGVRTVAVRWPVTRGDKSLDWLVPDMASDEGMVQYTTPSLLKEAKDAGVWFADHSFGKEDEGAAGIRRDVRDQTCVTIFNKVLREHRPGLGLLHLENVDHTEHLHGPRSPEAYAAIKVADDQVRQVWEEMGRDYPGKGTLVVVSDHGFAPVDRQILPNVILRDAGLVDVKGIRVVGGPVAVVVQGGALLVYVRDVADRAGVVARVRKAFDGVDGVSKVIGAVEFKAYGVADPNDDPHVPDAIVFAKEGYSFGSTAAGALPFVEKPERQGTHGHEASLPDLHATFVAWGAGIKAGSKVGEISNIDVAPTVAELLDVAMPGVDGKPVDGVLSK